MLSKPPWLNVVAALIYAFLYIPILVLILFSFDESRTAVHWTGFTVKWYQKLIVACGVTLSLTTIIVSHIVFCVAYVTLTVMGRLEGMDKRLEEAAQDLGASPVNAFFRVTLPLLMPGIIAGCMLAFVLSLDDFVITQFTAGVGSTTLPLRIFSLVKFGVSPEINALSTLMILFTVAVTLIAELIRRKETSATGQLPASH